MRNGRQEKSGEVKEKFGLLPEMSSYLNVCLFASKGKEIGFSFSHLLLHYIITIWTQRM